jgi:hypothetical protein
MIRGLLCHNCNVGIGNLRHDLKIIMAAAEYLASPPPRRGGTDGRSVLTAARVA